MLKYKRIIFSRKAFSGREETNIVLELASSLPAKQNSSEMLQYLLMSMQVHHELNQSFFFCLHKKTQNQIIAKKQDIKAMNKYVLLYLKSSQDKLPRCTKNGSMAVS